MAGIQNLTKFILKQERVELREIFCGSIRNLAKVGI